VTSGAFVRAGRRPAQHADRPPLKSIGAIPRRESVPRDVPLEPARPVHAANGRQSAHLVTIANSSEPMPLRDQLGNSGTRTSGERRQKAEDGTPTSASIAASES
jgi:hypothetical protein